MDIPQWSIPVARLPTIVTTQISGHLQFPVPTEPSNSTNDNVHSTDTLPTPLLNAVAAVLEGTDISHVRPRQNSVPFSPRPGSLEYAIIQCNQHAFAYAARPMRTVRHAVEHTEPSKQQEHHSTEQQQQPSAAEDQQTKTARHLPAKAFQGPAAKRRKHALTTDEEFVSRSMNAQQVADDVAVAISTFLEKAESLQEQYEYSGDEADGSVDDDQQQLQSSAAVAATTGHARKSSQPFLPLDLLKDLQTHLSHGKQAGVLGQLDTEQLRQLLKTLMGHVQLGDGRLLAEDDVASSAAGMAIAASLEAACCCLQLLAASSLPNSLYLDELLTAAVQMTKYQLQYNVLAFLLLPYRQLYRPSSVPGDGGQVTAVTAVKKRARLESASRIPAVVKSVQAKLELLLSLLAQVVDRVLLEVELLLPLVRVALTCLQVDSLELLQAQAIAFTVAVFRAYPQQRPAIMDEVSTTVIANIAVVGSRGPVRLFETTDAVLRPLPVMMATALVMQLVEASVQLPAVDDDADTIKTAFQGAYGCSDVFWKGVFARLPAAKAAKSDGAADFKLVVEALLADLSAVQMLPDWPAATILLRGFLKVLYSDKGLKHSDTAVKLAAVEFTGQLAACLCAEALAAEQTADEVQTLLAAAATAADASLLGKTPERCSDQLIHLLVLNYLSAAGQGSNCSSSITAAARRFICCRMLNDTLYLTKRQLGSAEGVKEELSLLLVQHRQLQDNALPVLGSSLSELELSRAQHVSLVRWWVVHGPLGAGRATLIKWLVEAGSREGKDPNPATVRTKVFKCLGSVVESDSRVLALAEVSAAVRAALEDDSVAVREAALELLAKLIHNNPRLAGDYFDVLVQASHDAGVSVRKRAIRSLWDCCNCSDFTRATEAVVTVLQRALDPEESMRSLVTKFCGDMWFSEGNGFAGLSEVPASSATAPRTAVVRARELADVALKAYEAGGKAIHVPLAQDYPLIVILKGVLGAGGNAGAAAKELRSLRSGAADVVEALLNMVLQQQELDTEDDGATTSSSNAGAFPYLLALHALCCADASLAAPEADPQRFVRCLAPYISASGVQQGILSRTNSTTTIGSSAPAEDSARRSAEECLCLLSVLEALLRHLGGLEQDTMKQMMADLLVLINKQRYLQLVAVGCQVLCTLAPLYSPVSSSISQLLTKCYNIAQVALMQQQGTTAVSPALTHNAPKVLYILGQLCRHGAAVIDAAAEADSSRKNCTECLELCVALWHMSLVQGNPVIMRVKDAALQAMGMLVVGKPQLMLQPLQLEMLHEQIPAAAATRVSDRGSPDDGSSTALSRNAAEGQQRQEGGGQAAPAVPRCAADVYHVALTTGSVSVKSRVLTNLVELLRSEEAVLVSRQKDSEAASSTSRLASTNSNETKAPLAKVNGASDAAADSSSSSIIQRVWEDVLKLATGINSGVGTVQMGTPGHAAAGAAAGAAAQMRRKALELIEVVLRGGLVAPWTAVAALVALLTDEPVDTRQAALKALRAAADKYIDFVVTQLAPGVIEAFKFQSRLWNAKHPGQPLPRSPGPGVLDALTAMYQHILAPVPSSRSKFLLNLLKPFAAACSLAEPAATAREDVHRLAFIAFVAAALPFKKADEPLILIYSINNIISRQAQEALDCLKHQLIKRGLGHKLGLDHDEELEVPAAADDQAIAVGREQQPDEQQQQQPIGNSGVQQLQFPLPQGLLAPLKASLALSMLLALKQYLRAAYGLIDERVAAFALKGEKYRAEQKALVGKSKQVGDFSLQRIDLKSQADATGDLLVEQYKVFKGLLECDVANYKEAAVLDDQDGAEAGLDASHVGATPAVAATAAGAPRTAGTGLVLYSMDNKKLARAKSSAKGASAAGKPFSTAGKQGKPLGSSKDKRQVKGGSTKGTGHKRRRNGNSEDSDEDWSEGPVPSKELF